MSFDTNRQSYTVASWTDFRKFIDGTYSTLAFFWQEKPALYRVVTEDYGGIRIECTITKDGGGDQTDFEGNFKALSPRRPGSAYRMQVYGASGSVPIPVLAGVTGTVAINNFPNNQGVTGAVGIVGPIGITGPVAINNFPNTQGVTGTVAVNNFPNTQGVTGRVGVSGTVSIIGAVGITGSVGVSGVVAVIGPVGITGPITIQTVVNPVGITGPITIQTPTGGYGGQIEGRTANGDAMVGNPVHIGGVDDGTIRTFLVDSLGRIITAPAGSSSAVTPGLAPGYVSTAATVRVAVRSTAFIEQTTNAQRSVVSANAADAAAGTGARTVGITYYTATFTGPFTTTVTLNGTTPVNTSVSDICYVEKMEVLTVGSGGQNAGIISLRATTAGGGATIASIAAADNETFYAHHYVPTGTTCYITGMSVGHNGTVVGSGGLYILRAQQLGVANSVDDQIGDFVRLYGQSSTISRVWGTALKVFGPSRITMYVTPESSSALIYRGSMDFYDQ